MNAKSDASCTEVLTSLEIISVICLRRRYETGQIHTVHMFKLFIPIKEIIDKHLLQESVTAVHCATGSLLNLVEAVINDDVRNGIAIIR